MAELATIARPYAEALFDAGGADAAVLNAQLGNVAELAANPELRQFADNPKVSAVQVFDVMAGVALSKGLQLDGKIGNLLRAVIDNGRLAALPEIAQQYQALVNASSGVSDATIESAFEIEDAQLHEVLAALEKRFARKLTPHVTIVPELIGGIRVIVGDEVLDTSVKARLEQMKTALTA
jgi:F-type H+-transporting ATPase subunit delta